MMIIQWYEPLTMTAWFKRIFSILNLIVVICTSVFIFSEFKYNWCEHLLGVYLVSINDTRPEKGTIWETGDKTSKANSHLKKIIDKQQVTKQNALNSSSLMELASGITPGGWINLDIDRFKQLYMKLPKYTADRLIPSAKLLFLLNDPNLDRIFIEGQEDKSLKIFFLNSDNLVLDQIKLNKQMFEAPESSTQFIMKSSLDDFVQFKDRIYSAKQFFKAMTDLSFDKVKDLIENPDILLEKNGRIVRVGICNETKDGYIQLGFEYKDKAQTNVLLINGREWVVWELVIGLKGSNI